MVVILIVMLLPKIYSLLLSAFILFVLFKGACGAFLECDANALCTSENQCKCRADLGFEGDGITCSFGEQTLHV